MSNFGIHWDGPIAWLLQNGDPQNFVGLRAKCPLKKPNGFCRHNIKPEKRPISKLVWDQFLKLTADPLVKQYLPIPKTVGTSVAFIEDPEDKLGFHFMQLARLSSPISGTVRPCWSWSPKQAEFEIQHSNIQNSTLVQVDQHSKDVVDRIALITKYADFPVVLAGDRSVILPPNIQKLKTSIGDVSLETLREMPLERIGAFIVQRYAQRIPMEAPL